MKRTASFIIALTLTLCATAQSLYIGSLYVTTPDEEALYGDGNDKWVKRLTVISDMFKFEQPDVLGLQSLTATQLSQISQRMSTYAAADNILYSKTLELVSNGSVSDMPDGSTCSWAKLKKGNGTFYVFNIFFSTDATVANNSSTRLVTAITEINTEGLPCFIIGNLGVSNSKTAYSRLSSRYNDCFTKAPVVSAEYGTRSNFDLDANHGADRYDFVFASKDVNIKAYGQLQYGYFTQEADNTYKRRLPSTHFPVMAKVTLPE